MDGEEVSSEVGMHKLLIGFPVMNPAERMWNPVAEITGNMNHSQPVLVSLQCVW